jgi:hypothetical protein
VVAPGRRAPGRPRMTEFKSSLSYSETVTLADGAAFLHRLIRDVPPTVTMTVGPPVARSRRSNKVDGIKLELELELELERP